MLTETWGKQNLGHFSFNDGSDSLEITSVTYLVVCRKTGTCKQSDIFIAATVHIIITVNGKLLEGLFFMLTENSH